ncbi:MAG: fused MFS/spermidine synthase [Alphaproteobacteria bacterium]|nr:fused MFS/spermidine synthase [Alphaproteobacteria bacterium]
MTTTANAPSQKSGLAALIVFSLTLFLSASMMFAIQPMTGKMLLPLVGGTPAGWIVAMAFFQIMLLGGYLLAHLFSKLSARKHALAYIVLLGIGVISMPIALARHAEGISATPVAHDIFMLLTFALALPFMAISATSSTIQRLFTTTSHKSAADPYFLYVASNIGSFSGLLLYPTLIEPNLSLSAQSQYLTYFYIALIGFALVCLLLSGKQAQQTQAAPQASTAKPVTWREYFEWMILALVPSSLLLGVTFHITTDIMSVPMIWVLPLALYLLTFVIAFSKKTIIPLGLAQGLHPWAVFLALTLGGIYKLNWLQNWPGIFFYLVIFFIVTLSCHLQLASRRPLESNSRHLTGFYLMMSVGGALGGIFNAFIVPVLSVRVIELQLALVLSLLLHPAIRLRSWPSYIIIAILCICASMMGYTPPQFKIDPSMLPNLTIATALGFALIAFIAQHYTDVFKLPTLMVITAVTLLLSQFMINASDILHSSRNFYGTIRIVEKTVEAKNPQNDPEAPPEDVRIRIVVHGTTTHGMQIMEPAEHKLTPTAYFSPEGPVGDIFKATSPKNVTVIGLGAGVMNCFNAPDRHFSFIEIDPAMVDAAQTYFTFLRDCKSASEPKIIVGDGRLEVEKMEDGSIDLLVVDAFSSDSIPTHLLTREALEEYLQKLAPNGAMVFHISNRYFSLEGLFTSLADTLGLQNRFVLNRYINFPYMTPSMWMVLGKPGADLSRLTGEKHWQELKPGKTRYWTDDYTNMMSVVQFGALDVKKHQSTEKE